MDPPEPMLPQRHQALLLGQRLLALFGLGLLLLNLPLVGLWLLAGPGWGGALGVFAVWTGLIAALALLLERDAP